MIVGALWLGSISLGQQGRMMKDFGLVAITGFGLIVAVFVAASLVHKEVEKRTVFVLFSKPVSRSAFISGKFVGLSGTMAAVVAGMGVFLFLLVWLVSRRGRPAMAARGVGAHLLAAARGDGGDDLLLDAWLRYPRQRARHLRVRRRAAEPQRARAHTGSVKTPLPRHSHGSCTCVVPNLSRRGREGRRRRRAHARAGER